jgi:phosphate uptake regulator
MQSYSDYVKRVTAIHHETVRRLIDHDGTNLREIAELFEDVANLYLNISEEIHAHLISEEVERLCPGLQSSLPSFPTEHLEAETEG